MKRGGRKINSDGKNVSSQAQGGPRPRARLFRWQLGGGPSVLTTGAAGGLHAPIVNEFLEHNSDDQFVGSQDEGKLMFLGSQEKQIVGTQDGSMEGEGGSV